MTALLVFPHQLYFDLSVFKKADTIVFIVEEYLFFKQYRFHKQKLVYHRACMRRYAEHLTQKGLQVRYIDHTDTYADARTILGLIDNEGYDNVCAFMPADNWLEKRLNASARSKQIKIQWFPNQLFINSAEDLNRYRKKQPRLFQTDFYIYQRKLRNILIDENGEPLGGKWSFDAENRKKYPAQKTAPAIISEEDDDAFVQEARDYVFKHFPDNPGTIKGPITYPTYPEAAHKWLLQFLSHRFYAFGEYEDAIVRQEHVLHHSVLTPMLNTGLLKPMEVIQTAIAFAQEHEIALNNVEGFVRQILGWREFIHYVYTYHHVEQRTKNYWQFKRKIPTAFYRGTTGITPIDDAVKKLNNTAYNHHIERLMVLSNFMLLCEFDPDAVYQWFMEMYIDAYDWVMVPNVYGMAQFADGGLMCTKPYISGSNYLFKMSDYKKDEPWAEIWDALFWRFMHTHRLFFLHNPRLSMLIRTFDKWPEAKKERYLTTAEQWLAKLDKQSI